MRNLKTFESFVSKNENIFHKASDLFRKGKGGYQRSEGSPKGSKPGNFVIIVKGGDMSNLNSNSIERILKNNPNSSYINSNDSECIINYENKSIEIKNEEILSYIKKYCDELVPIYFICIDNDLRAIQINNIKPSNIEGIDLNKSGKIKIITLREVSDLPTGIDRLDSTLIDRVEQPVVYIN